MANLDPWSYAAKTGSEHAEQAALFMWANMAFMFGPVIANDPNSYCISGFAKTQYENAGKIGYKVYSAPLLQLKWLHAIHNQGHDNKVRGAIAKAEGLRAGVSDIFLPVPKIIPNWAQAPLIGKCGLYIELKRKDGGTASTEQKQFQTDMRAAGYECEIIHGWELARDCILRYLGFPT